MQTVFYLIYNQRTTRFKNVEKIRQCREELNRSKRFICKERNRSRCRFCTVFIDSMGGFNAYRGFCSNDFPVFKIITVDFLTRHFFLLKGHFHTTYCWICFSQNAHICFYAFI